MASWTQTATRLHSGIADMGEFEDAYASWRSRPFPPGSTNDSLDELHADLALADTWVAETVIPFVEHGVSDPARIDVVNELRKLRSRAEELGRASDGEEARQAASYRDYFDVLLRVYEGFLTRAPKSR